MPPDVDAHSLTLLRAPGVRRTPQSQPCPVSLQTVHGPNHLSLHINILVLAVRPTVVLAFKCAEHWQVLKCSEFEKFISGDHKKFKSGFSGDSLISLASFSFTADLSFVHPPFFYTFSVYFLLIANMSFSDHSAFDSSV